LGRVINIPDPDTVARFDRRTTTRQIGKLLDQLV
jgi:hypothetical protein